MPEERLEFTLFGTVQASLGGPPVPLGRRRERCLLGVLLVQPGQAVPADRLVELLWDGQRPAHGRSALQVAVSRLRRWLAAAVQHGPPPRIVGRADGYAADIDPETVDLCRFERWISLSRNETEPQTRVRLLSEALALWQGEPLADVATDAVRSWLGDRYQELRLSATEDLLSVKIDQGYRLEVMAELVSLVDQHPTREALTALLMRVLHQDGRSGDALRAFESLRQRIGEELGIGPGPQLRRLHAEILSADLPPERGPAADEPSRRGPGPCQLPADVAEFTGLAAEQTALRRQLILRRSPHEVPVVVVTGRGGAGKTALAVHVAHALREQFPDGQLFLDLHGRRPPPGEVITRVLSALGVPDATTARRPDDQIELYRRELARRRVLLVLDGAVDEQQVRPLVPGTSGCAVIVTSRSRLAGLASTSVEVDVLPLPTAVDLLARIVGAARTAAEPEAAEQLVRQCGGLALAVRIAAARLLTKPHWSLANLAARLADERGRLDQLVLGDWAVRSTIGLGYAGLDEPEQRALRLLGRLNAPHFTVVPVADLLDTTPAQAEDLVERLVDARLVDVVATAPGRPAHYRLHTLVRLFAREQAELHEPRPDRSHLVTRAAAGWRVGC